MNPIEKAFSKLKAFLRKIAERTVAGLIRGRSKPAPTSSNLPNAQITSPPAAMYDLIGVRSSSHASEVAAEGFALIEKPYRRDVLAASLRSALEKRGPSVSRDTYRLLTIQKRLEQDSDQVVS